MSKCNFPHVNINEIKVSGWYPSNLVAPVKVNSRVFLKDTICKREFHEYKDDVEAKEKNIQRLNNYVEISKIDPIKMLSSEQDDFSYLNRLVPLYHSHFVFK